MRNSNTPKLIVVLGPTSSGKSDFAVKLAKKFNGEVVSADSRQVYKGMDIGTGKIKKREMAGIPHHLLDVASPKKIFTVIQYRNIALKKIKIIQAKAKIPILCGGTGFYIQSVIDGIIIPKVKPDWKLRQRLEKREINVLFDRLKSLDPKRASDIDRKNKRRIIRALEIIMKTKAKIPPLNKNPLPYPVLIIGIKKERETLNKLIKKRYLKWLNEGFLNEVKKLRENGLSWQKIESFGLHYKTAAQYLANKITYDDMIKNSVNLLFNYSKRQMVWLKKEKRIKWIKTFKESEKLAFDYINKKAPRGSLKTKKNS